MTRSFPFALVLAAAALGPLPGRAAGQTRPEPQLLLTIAAGATSGTTLYSNLRQPVALIEDPTLVDTLALDRRLSPGVVLGASATYFPRPNLGFTAEVSFVGFGRDDTCGLAYRAPSSFEETSTEQICEDLTAAGGTASTVAFEVGGMLRLASRGAVMPYFRAQAGLTARSASTVDVAGRYLDAGSATRSRTIIEDPGPGSVNPTGTFGAGVMIPFGAGYQARLELRDRLTFVERVTGPANSLAQVTTEAAMFHSVGLVFMLDIVLEQRRGRRY